MKRPFHIAFLGDITTDFTGTALLNECKRCGIETEVYHAPYRQYNLAVVDTGSDLYAFQPDLTILMPDIRILCPDWFRFKTLADRSEADLEAQVLDAAETLAALPDTIHRHSATKIIINNFKVPYHSPKGILDNRTGMGLKRMIGLLNRKLEDMAAATDYTYVFDYNGFLSHIGQRNAEDGKMAYLTGCPLSYSATKLLAKEYMRYILPLLSMNKKCLVLDLDNTLWGGIAGEDGMPGICLDLSGSGRCFYDFQEEILNLYDKGVLLAVNSRNNPEDALEIMEKHPHMLLRKEFFSCMKINWRDKASNLQEIASELNIGLDSLVFFDDNPVERGYVKMALPQVTVVEVPGDPAKYVDTLKNIPVFERLDMTGEDRKRNEMVRQNLQRQQSEQLFQSREDYLASLKTVMTLSAADEFNIPRISQLTQKTNQFNMTTKRYQVSDIKKMLDSGDYLAYCCSVSDRFGDNGITGCCIIKSAGTTAYIDTFLLSCRVLGRNVEYAFLAEVVKQLRKMGMGNIVAEYLPTEKNRANKGFFESAGFTPVSRTNGGDLYELEKNAPPAEFPHITCRNGPADSG